jgi:membrane fusion protein (multidrug efflux system)
MAKKLVITLLGLIVLIGLPAAIKLRQFDIMGSAPMVMPPETVTADTVRKQRWPNVVSAVGSLVAVQGVTVGAELGGKIVEIAFDSGDRVAAGELLLRIDTSAEEAQLRSAEAAAKLARINLERIRDLQASQTASKSDLDTAQANFSQAIAQADNVRAVIGQKTLRAPFAGLLGLRLVNLGQIVKAGDPVVTLQTIDPIFVDFTVPQQQFSALAPGTALRVTTDAAPGQAYDGEIVAVSPEIDTVTRSVRVRGTLANVGERLRPGMFAKVEVELPHGQEVFAIPATAVLYAPYGDTVFVIEDGRDADTGQTQKVLRQQIVRLGRTRGDFVAVLSGLQPGETVVTSGVFKLRPRMAVVVDNTLAPKAQLAPRPANE